jgi:hypothetical protein
MARAKVESKGAVVSGTVTLPLQWIIPEDSPIVYANHMSTQVTQDEVVLGFYRALPPVIATEQEADGLKIAAICVTRIVIPRGRFADFKAAFDRLAESASQESESEDENASD